MLTSSCPGVEIRSKQTSGQIKGVSRGLDGLPSAAGGGRRTVGRLPPGRLSAAIRQVDHIFYAVAVSLIARLFVVLRVTLETLV